MSFLETLMETPDRLSTASKYTVFNGWIYMGAGVLLIAWPGATQALFMERPFVGHEEGLIRALGLTVVVIGWLYYFGGLNRCAIGHRRLDRGSAGLCPGPCRWPCPACFRVCWWLSQFSTRPWPSARGC